ncbi:hypothetical protein [Laspinema olomoucense]|uniref:hypothetical protein n=1 Tax=Laspinema olomoucense TaxID=3231600 RepID=UPI0021BBA9E6|nr:hypothetical protein [Laspinema sp. D3c]MCT7997231.1 hypothetical protein [Laspinema sp. D3c]
MNENVRLQNHPILAEYLRSLLRCLLPPTLRRQQGVQPQLRQHHALVRSFAKSSFYRWGQVNND